MSDNRVTIEFNAKVVRQFLLANVLWAVVAMLVGVLIAAQLNFWQLNFNTSWLTWSRLRPLHTNAAIIAFSVAYNLGACGFAMAGLVNPLVAAVLMPASSLASLAIVSIGIHAGGWAQGAAAGQGAEASTG